MQTAGRYRGDHDGRSVEIELVPEGRGALATLRVDGRGVAEGSAPWPAGVKFDLDPDPAPDPDPDPAADGAEGKDDKRPKVSAVVRWWLPGRVLRVAVVEKQQGKRPVVTPLQPEPGAPGAGMARFEYDHPRLFAARHVVVALGQVLLPLLGISFAFRFLFRWLPDWNPPRIDLPDIPWPDLPNLWGWLPDWDLPDVSLPPWVAAVVAAGKFVLPVLVALYLANAEVRRRRRDRSGTADDRSSPTPEPSSDRREPPRRPPGPASGDSSPEDR